MTMTDGGDRRCDVPPALHHPTLPTPPILAKSTTIPATRHLVYSSLHRSRLIVGSSVTHFAITALSSWKCCDLQHYLVLTSKLLATEGVGAGGGNESKRQTTRQSTFGVLGKGGGARRTATTTTSLLPTRIPTGRYPGYACHNTVCNN